MLRTRALLPVCALGLLVSSSAGTPERKGQQKVAEERQVYVVGYVVNPMALPLKESLTVSQAIASAGGTLKAAKYYKVRIIRLFDSGQISTCVSLKQVKKHLVSDLQLQTNDILEVTRGTCSRDVNWELLPKVDEKPLRIIK